MEKMELNEERKEYLLSQLLEYRYNREINEKALSKLENIIEELNNTFISNGNTLAYQNSRIKEENSFLNKVNKRLYEDSEFSYDKMHDIVGMRLVVLSLSDVYEYVKLLKESDKIKILNTKDYIEDSKESGYMSYHIIVEVPVETTSGIKNVKCEIQIRTIFMDIFSREEHKLSYKGHASVEDKVKLKNLSDTLYFYDSALDGVFKIKNNSLETAPKEDLSIVTGEYDKISYLYGLVYDKFKDRISKIVSDYENKDDLLHVTSRIKPISSIKRKLVRKKLSCTAENILYKIRDVVGFKIVCTDKETAENFISYLKSNIAGLEKVEITNESNRLDEPKKSGYRGYKINLSYSFPTMTGNQPITIEILVRTMVMDAWALHDDKVFNNEDKYESDLAYKNAERQLRGLSPALYDVEEKLVELKSNSNNEVKSVNLVADLEEHYKNKKAKTLTLVQEKKE